MVGLESSGHKIGHKCERVAGMKRQKRTYRPFEVDEALLMYAVSGSMASAAGHLGIPEGTLYSWIHGANGKPGKYTERFKEIQGMTSGLPNDLLLRIRLLGCDCVGLHKKSST